MKFTKFLAMSCALALCTLSHVSAATNNSTINAKEIGSLATVAAIDKNEILVSIIAKNKNVDSSVEELAQMMIDQHGDNLTHIFEMVANDIPSHTLMGGISEKLTSDGKKEMITLSSLQGKEFEKAYVNAMVKGHEAALKLIDDHLLKTAKTESVVKFLTDTKTAVETHLEHAKKLQDQMKD